MGQSLLFVDRCKFVVFFGLDTVEFNFFQRRFKFALNYGLFFDGRYCVRNALCFQNRRSTVWNKRRG